MKPFALFILVLIFIIPAQAQENDCPTLFDNAINASADNCVNLADNTLCYGYEAVDLFVDCENFPDFASSGDTVPLDAVCMMRVSKNGIATMHIQPEHTAGHATFVFMGAGELHNASSGTFEMNAWMIEDAILRDGPGSDFNEVTPVTADEQLLVHACNCTQNWMRVMLDSGQIGWLPARTLNVQGNADALPVIDRDAPFYDRMQAITLQTQASECAELPNGLLIQSHNTERAWLPLQINNTELMIDATLFARAPIDDDLIVTVLEGQLEVTQNEQTYHLSAGAEIHIPREASDSVTISVYSEADVAQLPLNLLPEVIDPMAPIDNIAPVIISIPQCAILGNSNEDNTCPVTFVNPDGDNITQMSVEFLYAPEGDWESSVKDNPEVIEGDSTGGVIAWEPSCTLGQRCFIGPIKWLITLTDENGHTSAPFEASFNCVETR